MYQLHALSRAAQQAWLKDLRAAMQERSASPVPVHAPAQAPTSPPRSIASTAASATPISSTGGAASAQASPVRESRSSDEPIMRNPLSSMRRPRSLRAVLHPYATHSLQLSRPDGHTSWGWTLAGNDEAHPVSGLRVQWLEPGGVAAAQGLKPGDVIVAVDGNISSSL